MGFRDEYGLPRRELGAGLLALMIVFVLAALVLVQPASDFGYGAAAAAFIAGAVVCLTLSWLGGERGELFLPSLQSRLDQYELSQTPRQRMKMAASGAFAYVLLSLVPEGHRAVGIAFIGGGLAVVLTIFVLDRWVVLPRQLDEQPAAR